MVYTFRTKHKGRLVGFDLSGLCELSSLYRLAGAFPEVRQAQFPLGMGKDDNKSQGTLAVTLNADGQVNYDAVLKQSKLADQSVTSSHSALVPKVDDINKGVSTGTLASCTGQNFMHTDFKGFF